MLYHATYKPYLKSIFNFGLGGAPGASPKNYEDSETGVVYLATSPEVAISYADGSDTVPEEWLNDIVVLCIDSAKLDSALMQNDRNVTLDEFEIPVTYEYHGTIPPSALDWMGSD